MIDLKDFNEQFLLGVNAYQKVRKMNVFIFGLTPLGCEVAKNLVLLNINTLTLYDKKIISQTDTARNICLKKEWIGKLSRAEGFHSSIKAKSDLTKIQISLQAQADYIASNYDCVVLLDCYDKEYLIDLNNKMRQNKKGFIMAGILGLYGSLFVDFGNSFTTQQCGDSEQKYSYISNIRKNKDGQIQFSNYGNKINNYNEGDIVTIQRVKGMTEVNERQFVVKKTLDYQINIGDTTNYSEYQFGGVVKKISNFSTIQFKGLEYHLRNKQINLNKQISKQNISPEKQLENQDNIIMQSLFQFYKKEQKLPSILNKQDFQTFLLIAKRIYGKEQNWLDSNRELLLKNVSLYGEAQLSPCCTFWGAIVAQETIKLAGKFNPLNQWLHFNFTWLLQNKNQQLISSYVSDLQILFGSELCQKLKQAKVAILGASSVTCQLLKMFASVGLGCEGGEVTVVDDKTIVERNLNSKSLFLVQDIGYLKSQIACKRSKQLSQTLNVKAISARMNKDQSQKFPEQFWQQNDILISTTTRQNSRSFIDSKCIEFVKPLFAGHSKRLNGSCDVVIPHQTLSLIDLPQQCQQFQFDFSTILNFPHRHEHCFEYAIYMFESKFQKMSERLNNLYHKILPFHNLQQYQLQELYSLCQSYAKQSYIECLRLGLKLFLSFFYERVRKMLVSFPPDYITEAGKLFWSGLKYLPKCIYFNSNDSLHLQFVQTTSNIYAKMFGVEPEQNGQKVKEFISMINVSQICEQLMQSQNNKIIQQDQNINKNKLKTLINNFDQFKNQPIKISLNRQNIAVQQFYFIYSLSSLRSLVYDIELATPQQILRRIYWMKPNLITTNSAVSGLLALQIFKYFIGSIDNHRATTLSLNYCTVFQNSLSPAVYQQDKAFDPIMCGPVKVLPASN